MKNFRSENFGPNGPRTNPERISNRPQEPVFFVASIWGTALNTPCRKWQANRLSELTFANDVCYCCKLGATAPGFSAAQRGRGLGRTEPTTAPAPRQTFPQYRAIDTRIATVAAIATVYFFAIRISEKPTSYFISKTRFSLFRAHCFTNKFPDIGKFQL